MNPTKIEWCDYTWNPVTGCLNGCSYCYARRISMRFQGHFNPTFHPERLNEPKKVKKPSRIFAGSMTDMFGDWVKPEWLDTVLETMKQCPMHTFFVLTKCPQNINKLLPGYLDIPENLWIGTSVDTQVNADKRLFDLWKSAFPKQFVSFEPLLEKINVSLLGIGWIIIGGQTNPTKIPEKEWITTILKEAWSEGIPIFIKRNAGWKEKIQEIP